MKVISISVNESEYEEFRGFADRRAQPVAQLIREAMAHYRVTVLQDSPRLIDLPVFAGHKPVTALPGRDEVYDEVFERG